MEQEGATEQESTVCAFMGIGNSDQEMVQLNLDGKVRSFEKTTNVTKVSNQKYFYPDEGTEITFLY